MPRRLTEAQQCHYHRDGLAFPLAVLSPSEVQRYRAACDELETHLGGRPRTVEVRQMHLHYPWAYQLATHPAILDSVEDLLGPDLLIWATELFIKHPQDAALSIAWHRDQPYLGLTGGRIVTAWIALGPSTPSNGCMRALPRSAEQDHLPPPAIPSGGKESLPPPGSEAYLVDVVLQPGELSLHAPNVAHGSSANRSDEKRVGFVIRFVTPDARPLRGRPPVLLARGNNAGGPFTLVQPPGPTSATEALVGLRASALQHLDAVLENLKHAGRSLTQRQTYGEEETR
jgi:hypothetical protein